MYGKNFTFVFLFVIINIKCCCNQNAPGVPYTYAASIRVDSKPVSVGVILTTTWILTLCDCVSRMKNTPSRVTVRVGIISTESRIEEVRAVICPKAFKSNFKTPDINLALLQVRNKGIKLASSVRQGRLPLIQQNKTTSIVVKIARQPSNKASVRVIGWMKDMSYYTMKTDPGWRMWVEQGMVGKESDCKKYNKEWRPSMICAVFLHPKADKCDARGSLLVYNMSVWGLMNYKYAGCGGFHYFVPYINIGQKSNLQFIVNTIKQIARKNKKSQMI